MGNAARGSGLSSGDRGTRVRASRLRRRAPLRRPGGLVASARELGSTPLPSRSVLTDRWVTCRPAPAPAQQTGGIADDVRPAFDTAPPSPGYRPVTKVLHWLTVSALLVQFVIGYTMEAGDSGRGRGRGRGGESGRGRGRGGDLEVFGDNGLLTAHVVVGMTILVLAAIRLWWRRRSTLPPWAPGLSAAERRFAHRTEQSLYALLFVIPLSGLWLVLISDDAVAIHVASHIAFFVVVSAHVGLVLKHQLINRDQLLHRMV